MGPEPFAFGSSNTLVTKNPEGAVKKLKNSETWQKEFPQKAAQMRPFAGISQFLFKETFVRKDFFYSLGEMLRAYPEITGVPIASSNFASDEGDLTRHTLCMVRKIDEVWHKICK